MHPFRKESNLQIMTSEVIIDVQPKEISIALLEDKELVEYQNEKREASFSVGNIYLGKVKKLMPGLNACFVDVGSERDAFLHYLDLGTQFSSYEKYLKQVQSDRKKLFPISKASRMPDLPKEGSVQTTLKQGQEIMVQVVKEPISTKGPRLTCELSFAGRYMVLIPFQDKVSVSSKIKKSEERTRLKQLVQSIKPKNFGVIVRTSAEGKRVAELDAEMKVLLKRWDDAIAKVQKSTTTPVLAFEETGGLRRSHCSGEAGDRQAIHRQCTHLRQFQCHQTTEVVVRTDRELQTWRLSDYTAYGSHACSGREQR